jgi:hypothetical protein
MNINAKKLKTYTDNMNRCMSVYWSRANNDFSSLTMVLIEDKTRRNFMNEMIRIAQKNN